MVKVQFKTKPAILASAFSLAIFLTSQPAFSQSADVKPTKSGSLFTGAPISDAQPLPSTNRTLRLEGEDSVLQWPVYLTESQAETTHRFRIGYLAAISVMPEASNLSLSINGKLIGETPIKAPGAVKVLDFEIATGILKPGYNAVTLSVVQRHRVDCSLQATYELWTQIDPSWTGFVIESTTSAIARLEDLPAVAPNKQGLIPIEVILGRKPNLVLMEQIIKAAQQIALAGHFSHAVVEFAPEPRRNAGINLVMGSKADLDTIPSIKPLISEIDRAVTFLPASETHATTIVLSGETPTDVDTAIQSLSELPDQLLVGSPQGLKIASMARGKQVTDDETIDLADLGMDNRQFAGRYFKADFGLKLPLDFLPADYSALQINLAGAYAAGLEAGSEIVIDINGRNTASVPLAKRDGDFLRDEKVNLPLSRLRPGYNHIEISALVPTVEDLSCDTTKVVNDRKRFLLSNKTSLHMPQFARALRLPDLAVTTNGGLPYALPGKRPLLIVPSLDKDSLGAAATLAVQLGLAAARPIDFELSIDLHAAQTRSSIIVAPARSLDPALLVPIGLDADKIQQIWQGRADPPVSAPTKIQSILSDGDGMSLDRLRKNIPAACVLPTKIARAAPIPSNELSRRAATNVGKPSDYEMGQNASFLDDGSFLDSGNQTSNPLTDGVSKIFATVLSWAKRQFIDPPVDIDARSTLIIGQSLSTETSHPVTTLVTAPNSELLNASVICLTTPSVWSKVDGRVAQLNLDDGTITSSSTNHVVVKETQPRSFQNLRLVLAGWMSLNPIIFVVAILIMAVGLGITTNAMLRSVGRENEDVKIWKGKSVQKGEEK